MQYRKMQMQINTAPTTINEDERSVEAIGATESPVVIWDIERRESLQEVLLMDGCELPESRQVPLLDSHSRDSTRNIIGSFRDMKITKEGLVGKAVYSHTPEGESAFQKTKEGHLTDYSVGFRIVDSQFVPENITTTINGRACKGPGKYINRWRVFEVSACAIGADANAKARAEVQTTGGENMTQEQQVDISAIRADAMKEENFRITTIDAICTRCGVSAEQRNEFLKHGVTVETVREKVLEAMIQRSQESTPGFRSETATNQKIAIEMGADERDKFRVAATDAITIRSGKPADKTATGATDLAGLSLRELARESLKLSNQPSTGDVRSMIGRALTTSDFPLILANVANKSLFAGYETTAETWQSWCGIGSVSDFKTNTVVRAGEMADLDQIYEDEEYKYGTRSESQEQFAIGTYGKLFAISRQTIINDDLSALTDIPAAHGEAAARKIGDLAYAVLTANAAMGDGTALFHANHGNLGTTGAIGSTTVSEAVKLMALQKDIGGKRRLNISPKFLIAPPSLAYTAETFFKSSVIGTQANPNQINIYANLVQMIFEPRLYDASTTAWYFAGDKGKTVNVYFLNGTQAPYLETKQGWDVDGVEYKVRIDAGAKAIDWKSLLKNAGA